MHLISDLVLCVDSQIFFFDFKGNKACAPVDGKRQDIRIVLVRGVNGRKVNSLLGIF